MSTPARHVEVTRLARRGNLLVQQVLPQAPAEPCWAHRVAARARGGRRQFEAPSTTAPRRRRPPRAAVCSADAARWWYG